MSTEPGERRRRRELERAREHAAQQAAAPKVPAAVTPPVPVLSRRELRDLERAHTAQERSAATPIDAPARPAEPLASPTSQPAAQQPPPKPGTSPPKSPVAVAPKKVAPEPVTPKPVAAESVGRGSVAPTPTAVRHSYSKEAGPVSGGAPADAADEPVVPKHPVTRQSRRSMRPQQSPTETARTPVVNPPATTGTIRIVVPEATANDRPARTEGSSTPGRGYPPVAPRRSALSPMVSSAGSSPAPPRPSPSATPPSATPPSAGGGDFVWPTKAAPGSEQAPGPDRRGADDVVAASPDQVPALPARAGGAPLAPRWGHVPSGSFDAITRPPDDEEHPPVPVESSAEAKDASPARRSAAYTWLQMLALALLAFVLGFIVWLLIRGSTEPGATGASAPASTTSSSGTSWPHLGDL